MFDDTKLHSLFLNKMLSVIPIVVNNQSVLGKWCHHCWWHPCSQEIQGCVSVCDPKMFHHGPCQPPTLNEFMCVSMLASWESWFKTGLRPFPARRLDVPRTPAKRTANVAYVPGFFVPLRMDILPSVSEPQNLRAIAQSEKSPLFASLEK